MEGPLPSPVTAGEDLSLLETSSEETVWSSLDKKGLNCEDVLLVCWGTDTSAVLAVFLKSGAAPGDPHGGSASFHGRLVIPGG